MGQTLHRVWTAVIVLGLLGVGVGGLAYLVLSAPSPAGEPPPNPGRSVRAFAAERGKHRIVLEAYGTSQAADEWSPIAEVTSQVIEFNEDFEAGEILPKGTIILRLDETEFALAVERAQADVEAKEQELVRLEQEALNIKELLPLRQEQLRLTQDDEKRARSLGVGSGIQRDEYNRILDRYLQQRLAVQELQNSLALVPSRKKLQEASITAAKTQLKEAQRDLTHCTIKLPIAAMCVERSVERYQRVEVGKKLGQFLGLEKAEVQALIEPRKFLTLFPNLPKLFGTIDLTTGDYGNEIMRRFRDLNIPVDVTWRAGEGQAQWRGRAVRIAAALDQQTRTVPTIVEVTDAYREVRPGVKPALVPGLFCELTVYGETLGDVFVVPRDCLHDGRVYVSKNGKLHIQKVHVVATEKELAIIDKGLTEGDLVIMTDLFPVAEGMPLRVEEIPAPVEHREGLPKLSTYLGSIEP